MEEKKFWEQNEDEHLYCDLNKLLSTWRAEKKEKEQENEKKQNKIISKTECKDIQKGRES